MQLLKATQDNKTSIHKKMTRAQGYEAITDTNQFKVTQGHRLLFRRKPLWLPISDYCDVSYISQRFWDMAPQSPKQMKTFIYQKTIR